jgi:4-hydroxy-4-methyl-2-oxoglutarate aldolase
MRGNFLAPIAAACAVLVASSATAQIQASKDQILYFTSDYKGERYPDGRPKLSDDLVRRALNVSIEDAWGAMRQAGFNNQFEGNWQMLHVDKPFSGRALTAQYMPTRPDLSKPLIDTAKKEGRIGQPNIWPINMLQTGDVYVADGYGKMADGTLIGDNLGNSIYAKSKNGVVFDGSVRDPEGLSEINGFNAFTRGYDPSAIREMQMTQINGPIRIGRATVLPGDLVLAKNEGVIFIPAFMAKDVIEQSEFTTMRDAFGHQMLREGKFDPGEIDARWSPKVKAAFEQWIKQHPDKVPMSRAELDDVMKRSNW